MGKTYTQEYIYKHPWERVTSASWRKFTDHENRRVLNHILEVDTLSCRLDPISQQLYATRVVTVHFPGPWFIRKIVGQDICHCIESTTVDVLERKIVGQDICHCIESTTVDGQARSMQLTSRNVGLQNFIEVEEKIRYDPHPDNPNGWTLCRQETSIHIKPLSALASIAEMVEQRCAEKVVKNSATGREVMESICKYLEAESRKIALES